MVKSIQEEKRFVKWVIKKIYPNHTCRVDYKHGGTDRNCTSKFISDLLTEKLVVDLGYKIKNIQVDVKEKYV